MTDEFRDAFTPLSTREMDGAPERIRTSDPQIRSLVLYPAELRVPAVARECAALTRGLWRQEGAELSAAGAHTQGMKRR